jgi:sugar phosphate isomerase/epimerase
VRLAAESGLSWAEMPAAWLGADAAEASAFRVAAEDHGVRLVVAAGGMQAEPLEAALRLAAVAGAPVVRCTLSNILCGDRRGFPGGWNAHLEQCAGILEQVVPLADRLQVALAMENHQDAGSEDLLNLCRRFETRYLGITLDTGNPLAVMEGVVEFAERVAPYLRHAHLKDYRIYHAPNGFRLVRCSMGAGVIDFAALLRLFDAQEWPITRNLEQGALQARLIPMLEPSWWEEHAPRDARDLLPALTLAWSNLRPVEEEWRTPYELGDSHYRPGEGERGALPTALATYEWREYLESLAYLHSLMGSEPPETPAILSEGGLA